MKKNIKSFPPLDRGGQEGCRYNDKLISTPTPTLPIKGASKCAFTLAEVLITLVIIGVIAAITVPTLIVKYQKEQTVTRLKKVYSTLSQTTTKAVADNGNIVIWAIDDLSSEEISEKYFYPYLNVQKKCQNDTSESCSFTGTGLDNSSFDFNENTSKFYLTDGTLIAISPPSIQPTSKSVYVYIDINGKAKPNKLGKDVFIFVYWFKHSQKNAMGKFIPWGGDWTRENIINSSASYACNKSKNGGICAALIVKDGWRIADDYPW